MEAGTLLDGRYRLDHRIASGGMGTVWSGSDTRLDRPVAVKILHHFIDSERHPQERFEREAKLLARLKGPGFVEIYDFGEDHDGDHPVRFIVMELVEGTSLSKLLNERGLLKPEETMVRIAEAAEALDKAHRQGIVHRDVNPSNLIIDADNHVRVVDFGISLLSGRTRLTQSGAIVGTLAYLAPEQLGKADPTGATDLYALGAVAYECLTGRPPFTGDDTGAVLQGHLLSEPPALPEGTPVEVSEIIMRALRKSPEERWDSGAALADACRRAAGDEFVPDPPEVPRVPGPDRWPRRLIGLAAVLAVLVLVAALTSWRTWIPFVQDNEGDTGSGPGTEEVSDSPDEATNATGEAVSPTPSASADATTPGQDESGQETDAPAVENEPDEPTSGEVPDVYLLQVSDAKELLENEGFVNVSVFRESGDWNDSTEASDDCQVVSQDPPAGETADFDDQIRLGYYRLYYHDTVCE